MEENKEILYGDGAAAASFDGKIVSLPDISRNRFIAETAANILASMMGNSDNKGNYVWCVNESIRCAQMLYNYLGGNIN